MKTADVHRRFDALRETVYGWAFRLLRNHHDALDVTQDVFIKWWRAQLKDELPSNPTGWLRRVTINQAIDATRSVGRQRAMKQAASEASYTPTAEAELRELADAVRQAMSSLSEQQRSVLFAKVYDGCTFAVIADQMEISVPTVKTHYLRALHALRPKLIEAGVVPGDDYEV